MTVRGNKYSVPASGKAAARFAEAVQHHQSGNLDQAEKLYAKVLAADPKHTDCRYLLGVIASQRGQFARAVELIGGITRKIIFSRTASLVARNVTTESLTLLNKTL